MSQLQCIVVTPERTVVDESAQFVALPLYDGEIGIAADAQTRTRKGHIMETSKLEQLFNSALGMVVDRLEMVTSESRSDFPQDNGIAFRNKFFSFPYSLFCQILYSLENEPDDPWCLNHAEGMTSLRPDQIVALTGHCHFFVESRMFYLHCADIPKRYMQIMCAWIHFTYELGAQTAKSWYTLVTEGRGFEAYHDAAEDLLYQGISQATGKNVDKSHDGGAWPGMAMMAEFNRPGTDDDDNGEIAGKEEWNDQCSQFFG